MTSLTSFLRGCYLLRLLRPMLPLVWGFVISYDGYFLTVRWMENCKMSGKNKGKSGNFEELVSGNPVTFSCFFTEPYAGTVKTICCIPVIGIVLFFIACLVTGIGLLVTYGISDDKIVNGSMITLGSILLLGFLSNVHNFGRAVVSLVISQKSRVMKVADKFHRIKMEGLMQSLKHEVALMNRLVTSMDKYTKHTTRLVVIVDGLDSCEQEKVLQVLDIIHTLFNEEGSSFVTILAVDPQIIIKGIDQNLKSPFYDTNVNGFDYLRNIVHLPFYLQSQGLQVKKQDLTKTSSTYDINRPDSPSTHSRSYRVSYLTFSWILGWLFYCFR